MSNLAMYPLSEELLDLKKMARDFVEKEIIPRAAQNDANNEFDMEAYKKYLEIGFLTLSLPTELGGQGMSEFESVVIREEIARGDAGFSSSAGATMLAYTPILLDGNDAQKKKYADLIHLGAMGAFCLTEAEAGSDAGACRTTAVKDGDSYLINGSKCFITNGGLANFYVVFATVDKSKGIKGLTAFIVERDRPGVSVGKKEDKMGIRSSNTTDVIFEDVRIPAENLVGAEGKGFGLAMRTLDRNRPIGSAGAVGICQRAIDESMAYAKERKTFGKPIIENQAIQFMLADMEIQTQAARQLVWHSARLIDHGVPTAKIGAVTKCFAGDTAMKVTTDAVQILGGYGYCKDYPVEKLMRDAKIYQIYEGTNQIQRMVIAGNMMKGL